MDWIAPSGCLRIIIWDGKVNFYKKEKSRTIGGDGASESQPINLDEPAPAWIFQKLDYFADPDENKIYTQRILAHPLYPYSVRPDLRLRDTNKGKNIKNHVLIKMFLMSREV